MMKNSLTRALAVSLGMLGVGAAVACSDSGSPTPGLSLSFSSMTPAAVSARVGPSFSVAADTFVSGANTLIITKAQLVLRDVRLKKQEVADCDVEPEPAGCEGFKTGPILLDLPVTIGATPQVTISIPVGTYTRVEFKVHKVGSSDTAFAAANPTMVGKSIHVEGTFNGTAFVFESDLDVEQKMELATPLVVADTMASTNLTVRVDLATWFKTAAGVIVDPATANKGAANEGLVTENIKKSMKAFRDKEHDGGDDDNGNH